MTIVLSEFLIQRLLDTIQSEHVPELEIDLAKAETVVCRSSFARETFAPGCGGGLLEEIFLL